MRTGCVSYNTATCKDCGKKFDFDGFKKHRMCAEVYKNLLAICEELISAGNTVHSTDPSGCHQDCPWMRARDNATQYLQEIDYESV